MPAAVKEVRLLHYLFITALLTNFPRVSKHLRLLDQCAPFV